MRGFNNSIGKIIETLKAQVSTLNSNYANIKLDYALVANITTGKTGTVNASLANTHIVFATLYTGSSSVQTVLWNFNNAIFEFYDGERHRVTATQSGNTVTVTNANNAAGWAVRFNKVGVAK